MIALLVVGTLSIQQDTVPKKPVVLTSVVVTVERSPTPLSTSTSAVTRIPRSDLARFSRATIADLLRLAPGLVVVDFDGLGYDPQLMVRGFYGGGEAEYVVVLVDGVPQNRLETGVVAWDALPPLASIEAIEVVRGGASSLYGDAAIGGVINVITRRGQGAAAERSAARWEADGGSYSSFRAGVDVGAGSTGLGGGFDRTTGYRDHAERTLGRVRGGFQLLDRPGSSARVDVGAHWRGWDEPGPLLERQIAQRRSSDPLFRFDHTGDQDYFAGVSGERHGAEWRVRGFARGELRHTDAIRTLALAPGFGDTKERIASTRRGTTGFQLECDGLVAGFEASFGSLESRYYNYQTGTRDDYTAGPGSRGSLDTKASSDRLAAAVFAQYSVVAGPARLSVGARWDGLHDRFRPQEPAGAENQSTGHGALSPKAGVNVRFTGDADRGYTGHIYLSASRSFKAPTLDQLYDQRNIPVPFPPFQIQTSNPDLDPQRGTNFEVGSYQEARFGELTAALSLSGYQIRMTDEIDFDLNTFRYVNIGKSRHRGVEAGLRLSGGIGSTFLSYSLQDARAQSGDNSGNRLKAIPRHSISGGGTLELLAHRLSVSGMVAHLRGMFLDDANTTRLPNYTRVDGRVTVRVMGLEAFGEVRNLFGALYSSTGFLDPSGSGEAYLYPAAGRTFRIGVVSDQWSVTTHH